jgi:hypothetical protein
MTIPVVKLAAEGLIDIAILQRLMTEYGLVPGEAYGLQGKAHLDARTASYSKASQHEPWMILRDLDHDAECPSELRAIKVSNPGQWLQYRIAVREAEVWLMADRETFCKTYHIPVRSIPANLEKLSSPKTAMLEILAKSKSRDVREAMVRVRPGQPIRIGAEYNTLLSDYALRQWTPSDGAVNSRSLYRALARLKVYSNSVRKHWNEQS